MESLPDVPWYSCGLKLLSNESRSLNSLISLPMHPWIGILAVFSGHLNYWAFISLFVSAFLCRTKTISHDSPFAIACHLAQTHHESLRLPFMLCFVAFGELDELGISLAFSPFPWVELLRVELHVPKTTSTILLCEPQTILPPVKSRTTSPPSWLRICPSKFSNLPSISIWFVISALPWLRRPTALLGFSWFSLNAPWILCMAIGSLYLHELLRILFFRLMTLAYAQNSPTLVNFFVIMCHCQSLQPLVEL